MQKTALYDEHVRLGGRMVDFGGFLLPVQYSGIVEEHKHVREAAGLFDVSHMGEFMLEGEDSLPFLQYLLTNDCSKLQPGRAMYSPMCQDNGGTVDDLLIYFLAVNRYMIVVNASNTLKDWDWMNGKAAAFSRVQLTDVSSETGLLALQGPKAQKFLQQLTDTDLDGIRIFRFRYNVEIAGVDCLVSRTGYTGEDGFEIYFHDPALHAVKLWESILSLKTDDVQVKPAGLGARDSLRLEAALSLYGHELTEDINPLEAGLSRFVKFDKGDFCGRDALLAARESGNLRQLIGLKTTGQGIPRASYPVALEGRVTGSVTSGGVAPSLDGPIAMALMEPGSYQDGQRFDVLIRGREVAHEKVSMPFYRKPDPA